MSGGAGGCAHRSTGTARVTFRQQISPFPPPLRPPLAAAARPGASAARASRIWATALGRTGAAPHWSPPADGILRSGSGASSATAARTRRRHRAIGLRRVQCSDDSGGAHSLISPPCEGRVTERRATHQPQQSRLQQLREQLQLRRCQQSRTTELHFTPRPHSRRAHGPRSSHAQRFVRSNNAHAHRNPFFFF